MAEKLLRWVGPLHIVGGLLLLVTGFIPSAARWLENTFSHPQGPEWSVFFVAILGPTIASWGVLFTAIVDQYYRAPSTRLWRFMLGGVLVWAVFDTALCVYAGLLAGVVLNTLVVVTLLSLLWIERPRATHD